MGGAEALKHPLLAFGMPPDAAAWGACAVGGIAVVAIVFRGRWQAASSRVPTVWILAALAAAALLLSAGYIAFYLRGGPRIIDATSYFLEGRALARGAFAFDVPSPSGSFRGRFLVSAGDSERLGVIFPPGYPAALALGWLAGAPLAVGPLIAAALVLATAALALTLFGRRDVAIAAALLSVLSAALRYHTADTMSHGWAALLLTAALLGATRGGLLASAGSGLAIGWLVATRPVTAVVGLVVTSLLVARRPREIPAFALAMVPGLLLLGAQQHALTGSWLSSVQLRYYALADGPPGCFRYGFGTGVGCLHEHGDFAGARLREGFGLAAAAGTTLRRLWHHALDVGNFEPLALLVAAAPLIGRRAAGVRLLWVTALAVIFAYVPFYFDATYPGGGARLYADALPLEHVLAAWVLAELRLAHWAAPVSLVGFALHASFGHRALAEREGGRPMFEPTVLEAAGVRRGVVLVDTDHGFNLGHAPGVTASRGVVVARATGDAHERVLWELSGRPSFYRYVYRPSAPGAMPRFEPYAVKSEPVLRFEAEHEWPPLVVRGGWVRPEFVPCASGGRALRLISENGKLTLTLETYTLEAGAYELRTGWARTSASEAAAELEMSGQTWWDPPGEGGDCWVAGPRIINLSRGLHRLTATLPRGERALDFVELRPNHSRSNGNP